MSAPIPAGPAALVLLAGFAAGACAGTRVTTAHMAPSPPTQPATGSATPAPAPSAAPAAPSGAPGAVPSAASTSTPEAPAPASPAAPAPSPRPPAAKPAAAKREVLLGPATREQIEAAVPEWGREVAESHPDAQAAKALLQVPPGGEVLVFLGTWCGDSRREVSRFWRALDDAGAAGAELPFTLRYVGVSEDKRQPAPEVAEFGLRYMPTFVVRRGGKEVGRVVEISPGGIEVDLLALLGGKASGLLTASPRAAQPASPAPASPSPSAERPKPSPSR
jgi:hypothetical protein